MYVCVTIPISLLHVPSIIFSSIRNICRPGKPFAHPRPVKSRNTDAWLYGLYSYACVPLPALKPIYKIKYCACVFIVVGASAGAIWASVNCGYVRINKCENIALYIALVCKDNLCFVCMYVCALCVSTSSVCVVMIQCFGIKTPFPPAYAERMFRMFDENTVN